jgi:hypothetical protein
MSDDAGEGPATGRRGRRDVVVPLRLYKTVTVFSTLLAVLAVVIGFTLLDAATLRVSLVRGLVVGALSAVGLRPPADVLGAALAVAGLATIGLGAGVYTLGTRFRTAGMGGEGGDDGAGAGNENAEADGGERGDDG